MRESDRRTLTLAGANDVIRYDHNHDGIDRRGFLKCMAWARAGAYCVVQGGVMKSFALGEKNKEELKGELSFVQISDRHLGFSKPAIPTWLLRCRRRSTGSMRCQRRPSSCCIPATSVICRR